MVQLLKTGPIASRRVQCAAKAHGYWRFRTRSSVSPRPFPLRCGKLSLDARNALTAFCIKDMGKHELVAYVDGASHGNPGPAGVGLVIEDWEGTKVQIVKSIGRQDNNVAEYVALLEALQYALARKARALHVYCDSEVVFRQMTGEYACRSPRLYSLHWVCRKLARSLKFSIAHVRRENNAEANRLALSGITNSGS